MLRDMTANVFVEKVTDLFPREQRNDMLTNLNHAQFSFLVHIIVTHDTSDVSRGRLIAPSFHDQLPRPCQQKLSRHADDSRLP